MTIDEIKKQIAETLFKNGRKSWDFVSDKDNRRCFNYFSNDFKTPFSGFNDTEYYFISLMGFDEDYSIYFVNDYGECSVESLFEKDGQKLIDFLRTENYIK